MKLSNYLTFVSIMNMLIFFICLYGLYVHWTVKLFTLTSIIYVILTTITKAINLEERGL